MLLQHGLLWLSFTDTMRERGRELKLLARGLKLTLQLLVAEVLLALLCLL